MNSNMSSPDNNNYGGQVQAYKYQSLNETPTSPELANHRALGRLNKTKTPATPPGTPEIIQVLTYFFFKRECELRSLFYRSHFTFKTIERV